MNKKQLQHLISETTQSLKTKIEKLEESTLETVESVTSGVKQTAETIQQGLKNMSFKHHIEKHPMAVVAASLGLGAALSLLSKRKKYNGGAADSIPRGPSLRQSLANAMVSEISRNVAPTLLGFAVEKAGEWAKTKITEMEEKKRAEKNSKTHF